MGTEYDSTSTFIDLGRELRAIAAPIDVQGLVLRMAQDELRHASIAAAVVEAMGGEAKIETAGGGAPAHHADCGPDEAALRTVVYGCCLSETVNAGRLAKQVGETRDPFVRAALRLLLADERRHAQFGFHYLESRRAWLDAHPEVRQSLARYLRIGLAHLEQYMGAVPVDARLLTDEERAIGLPDPTELSKTFQEIVLNACLPGLERFGIAAGEAWRSRALAPDA
jgi:hypothetical protein